jgi:AcrR family transcriptional regulator
VASRKEDAQRWRRGRIIEAAASVFVRRGFHGATMDDIAREAGYSTPSLYNYFKNKEEIFHAVVTETSRDSLCSLRKPVPPELPFDRCLVEMLRRLFSLAEQNRDLFVAFVAQRGFFEWDLRADLGDDAYRAYVEALGIFEGQMQRGIAEGALRPEGSASDYAAALVGITNAFIFRWLMASESDGLEQQADRIVCLFLNGAARR